MKLKISTLLLICMAGVALAEFRVFPKPDTSGVFATVDGYRVYQQTVPSVFGNVTACEFDGTSDYIQFDTESAFDMSKNEPFSLAFWVRTHVEAGVSPTSILAKKPYGGGWGIGLWWQTDQTVIRFQISSSTSSEMQKYVNRNVVTNTMITPNIWYHVVATYNGTSASTNTSIYINGAHQVLAGGSWPTGSISNDNTCRIGDDSGVWGYLNGDVDEVMVFTQELTKAEAQEIYNGGDSAFDLSESSLADYAITWIRHDGDSVVFPVTKDSIGTNVATYINMTVTNLIEDVP